MTRPFSRLLIAAGVAGGLALSSAGVAYPASKPPVRHTGSGGKPGTHTAATKGKLARPVLYYNQTQFIAQGLTATEALRRDSAFVKRRVSTPHYIPRGFQLTIVRVFPYIPSSLELGDTQTFQVLSSSSRQTFEIDHQIGSAYVYTAPFTVQQARAGSRAVTVAEEKVRDIRSGKAVDLLNISWFDNRSKIATEVTADLVTSRLSRAQLLQVAASVS